MVPEGEGGEGLGRRVKVGNFGCFPVLGGGGGMGVNDGGGFKEMRGVVPGIE